MTREGILPSLGHTGYRIMKRILILLSIVVLVPLLLMGGLFFLLANPGYYKGELVSTVKEKTGFELEIGGDINWRYWPPVALNISDVKVRPPGAATPLAGIKSASVSLELWPLIFGNTVAVDGLRIDGMTVNALVDKSGKANWQVKTPKASPAPSGQAPAKPASPETGSNGTNASSGGLQLDIRSIDISNSVLNYQDAASGANYAVTIPRIHTGTVKYNSPVPVDFNLSVADKTGGMEAKLAGDGELTFNQGFKKIGFSKLNLRKTINMPGLKEINTKLRLEGSYDVAASKLAMDLDGSVNSSDIRGKIGAVLGSIPDVTFDLDVTQVNPDDFLPSTSKAGTTKASSAPPSDVNILPLDALNKIALDGKLRIGKLTYTPWTFNDATLALFDKNHRLTADLSVKGYEGTASLNFVGSTDGQGAGHTKLDIKGVDITRLTDFKSITGKIQLNSNTTFTGHMLSSLMNSLDGTTTFDITDGTLDVTPIKRIAQSVDSLRGKTSGVADWPDKMPFKHLKGMHRFINGTKANQQFNFAVENLAVTGTGGFDYFAHHLDFHVAVSLNQVDQGQFKVNESIAGVQWPMHCEGSFSESPSKLCRPDSEGIRKAIGQTIKKKAESNIREKVQDKLKNLFDR